MNDNTHRIELVPRSAKTAPKTAPNTAPGAVAAILLIVALFGATTAAAIKASNRADQSVQTIWHQNQPSILPKLPDTVRFEELLF